MVLTIAHSVWGVFPNCRMALKLQPDKDPKTLDSTGLSLGCLNDEASGEKMLGANKENSFGFSST